MDMKIYKMISSVLTATTITIAMAAASPEVPIAAVMNSGANPSLAPGWTLLDLNGKTVQSADFKGKVVVLDFWATWCPPCRAEIPGFAELQKQYGASGLAVVGVSVDQTSNPEIKSFTETLGVNYPVVLADAKIVEAFGGIDGLPTTFVIDQTGHVVHQHLGYTSKSQLEAEIKALLPTKPTM